MNPRRLGVLVLLAALGVAAGFGAAALLDDEPDRFDDATPVAASRPSVPSMPVVEVLDDPKTPPLTVNQPTHLEKIGSKPFVVRVPVPDGWLRNNSASGEWKWTDPDQPPDNAFFLRVRLISNSFQSVSAELDERIADLSGAESVSEFELTSQSSDSFAANYVSGGYRRFTVESFVSTNGDELAEVWVAVIGRETDEDGLGDLLTEVREGLSER